MKILQGIIFGFFAPVGIIIGGMHLFGFHTTNNDDRFGSVCYTDYFCIQKNRDISMTDTYIDAFIKSQKILNEKGFKNIGEDYARFWRSNNMIFEYKQKGKNNISVDLITKNVIIGEVDNEF